MRAIVADRYGPPSILRLTELPAPRPAAGEVLVRVRAASVNALDRRLVRGDPWLLRLGYGIAKPKHRIPGADAAGVVEEVGAGVTELRPGDEVFADLSNAGMGAFAERVAAPAGVWARKPQGISFEEAAAIPVAGVTALQGLRDVARVRAGERVLVNGAAGGVGSFAVQIARSMGAEVTGVCSARSVERVRGLGAARVVDREKEDPTRLAERVDVVLDCAAHRSPRDWRGVLAEGGRYVLVGGSFGPMLQILALGPLLSGGGVSFAALSAKAKREDLQDLARLVERKEVRPLLDERFPLAEAAAAVAHVDEGHARGKTVITIADA